MDIATMHGPYGNPPPALATLPPEIVAQNRELIHAVKALNAAEQLALTDVFDPRQNVQGGAKYLKQLLGRYTGDVSKALAAYNAGTGRVDSAGGVPSIPETINYVSSILAALPIR